MKTTSDPLQKSQPADRLWYAFGALLDDSDFTVEQTYHRGRLGRVLAYLHGMGTVAGLFVGDVTGEEEMLKVEPGLAVDRLGRLIEVKRAACLRLNPWFSNRLDDPVDYDKLVNSLRPAPDAGPDSCVVDLFVKFESCTHALQPAFATGNFEALNAVEPSRIRDGYRLELLIRQEETLPVPDPGFPDLDGLSDEERNQRIIDYKLKDAWKESTLWRDIDENLTPLTEHGPGQDGTELLLARLYIPAVFSGEGVLMRQVSSPVVVDNSIRRFSFSTAELAWLTNSNPSRG